jgi:hypothetical protein
MQASENKRKQNCFHLLPFISPNRDFSMGCERRNKKEPTPVLGCAQNVSRAPFPLKVLLSRQHGLRFPINQSIWLSFGKDKLLFAATGEARVNCKPPQWLDDRVGDR